MLAARPEPPSEAPRHPFGIRLGERTAGPVIFAAVGAAYLALAQLVIWLNDPVGAGAGLWPAAGLSLAALLMTPRRRWGWVLAAVVVAEVGGDLAHGYSLAAGLGWALANAVEPLVGALLLRRAGNRDGALAPIGPLMSFLVCAVVVAPMIGAGIGALASVHEAGGSYADVWLQFAVGDALGVLIVAPVLLTLRMRDARRSRRETAVLCLGALVVAVALFSEWVGSWTEEMAYLLVPFFTWAALRYGVRATAWLSFGVTLLANAFIATGDGPFSVAGWSSGQTVTLLQTFLMVTVAGAFVLAAISSELLDRDQVEAALRHQASHDLLTGLPNRVELTRALRSALASATAGDGSVVLMVCDIDHLKAVNDRLGHRAGDELITRIAERLRAAVRSQDLVTRISGDEFVVVLTDVDRATTDTLCRRIIGNVTRPALIGAHAEVVPSVSIGVAIGEPGMTGEEIFNGADMALYEAKQAGRGRTVHFDERLRRDARARRDIEADLPRALSEGQIHCLHQPEIELRTGALFGFESLARWQHPERGLVMPDRFIPAVEATGNTRRLFETVLTQTLQAQSTWAEELGFRPSVAVNLSALQLADPDLPLAVARALERAGAPGDTLWLELTETGVAGASALDALTALSEVGVHLALDDFGTGWSSMERLSQHPWELLKIDRSFVAPLGTDAGAEHIVRAMIVMAHALGIRTVAEGVETPRQLERLEALGCDIVQGFLFRPGVTAAEARQLVDGSGAWTGHPVSVRPPLRGRAAEAMGSVRSAPPLEAARVPLEAAAHHHPGA